VPQFEISRPFVVHQQPLLKQVGCGCLETPIMERAEVETDQSRSLYRTGMCAITGSRGEIAGPLRTTGSAVSLYPPRLEYHYNVWGGGRVRVLTYYRPIRRLLDSGRWST
jgi:hypothetical protein